MVIAGPFLSTLLPVTGPAVAQFPALSQTARVPVAALAVSVPAVTFVISEKEPSAALASPDAMSPEVQAMLTSAACQRPSGWPHAIVGGVVSATVMLAHVVAPRGPLLAVTQTMCVAGVPAGPGPTKTA